MVHASGHSFLNCLLTDDRGDMMNTCLVTEKSDYINPVTEGWESFYLTAKDADILTHCMEMGTMSKTAVLRTAIRYYESILESEVS